MALLDYFKKNTMVSADKKKGRLSSDLTAAPIDRVKMEMNNLRMAVDEAQDIYNPRMNTLIQYYDNAMKDPHVQSQVQTAYNMLLAAPFMLSKNGNDDPALSELLQTPWFEAFIRYAFEAELYGYSLVEFSQLVDAQFETCNIFPRRHVNPKRKEILLRPTDSVGIPYYENLYQLGLLEIGNPESLGTLELITREVIWKNFARSDWSAASERFGMPFLFMKTNLDDPAEVAKRANMLSNMGTKGWAIGDLDDEVEIKETSKSDFYQIYEKNARYCDEQISKIINGQTGTSDEKAFVGSAEVHERILNEYTDARLRKLTIIINYELLPFLVFHGYPLEGCKFRFTELDPKQKEKKRETTREVETDEDPEPVNRGNIPYFGEKKKAVAAFNLSKLLNEYLKRIYDGAKGIDKSIWKHNFGKLSEAIENGYGVDFKNTDRQDAALAYQLRENAAVYSAFKNHVEAKELTALLLDESGKLKSFAQFKKDALPLTETYNKTWLETEYNQAVSVAEMAAKWESFKENADIYPNLQYQAVMDERTRHEHAILNGVVLPLDHPFWNDNYPPNGWGCRCDAIQTDAEVKEPPKEVITPDKGFSNNPGKSGKLFADDNPYQAQLTEEQVSDLTEQAKKLLD